MIFCISRVAIEYEKKGYAENYEHGQVMEKKLVSMARELEKLRAEVANAEKRAHASAAAVGNAGMHILLSSKWLLCFNLRSYYLSIIWS